MPFETITISAPLKTFLSSAARRGEPLSPGEMRAALGQHRFPSDRLRGLLFDSEEPAVVFENLPLDAPGLRPGLDGTPVANFVLRALINAAHLEVFGYPQEMGGALFHDICPVEGAEHTTSNSGRIPFALHNENPVLPRAARPMVLALYGIDNESRTETMVLPISRITRSMPKDVRTALESPIFSFRQNLSFDMNGYGIQRRNMVILRKRDGYDEFRWAAAVNHLPSTDEGNAALEWVKNIYESLCDRVVLQPGQAVMFNNHRCLHGRGAVQGRRWLKRAYGTTESSLLVAPGHIDIWNALAQSQLDHSF